MKQQYKNLYEVWDGDGKRYLLVSWATNGHLSVEVGEMVGPEDAEAIDVALNRDECIDLAEFIAANLPIGTFKPLPRIVCLCGSTRFWRTFQEASLQETLAGKIVLSIGAASGTDDDHFGNLPREEYDRIKADLDRLHLRKIDLADEVLILNVGGYIGESTRRELEYAKSQGKRVRYWDEPGDTGASAS